MAFRIRSSKFRHVFGKPARKEHCYENIRITRSAHDGCFCAVNPKFLAIVTESSSGGAFLVLPIEKTGRFDGKGPKIGGHRGQIMDLKWNPFNDHIIASCAEDCTVKVWEVPEGGLVTNMCDWVVDLQGHQKRVAYIEWHPTAESIILSAGYDYKCILWNIETAEPISIITCHTDTIFSISWNRDGSLFATTCKDKRIRVIDPRSGEVLGEGEGPPGPKASKVAFLGDRKKLFVLGFSRSSERLYSVWDIKDMSKPLVQDTIDSSCGTNLPFYDPDTRVAFTAGKGDGNIRYFEITDEPPYCHFLSQYLSPDPQRGLGVMPKRGLDTSKNEIMRFYKLHAAKDMCEPIPMIVPRRSEEFQDDIYPPTASSTPSLTADEWISGQNRDPILISLKDGRSISMPKITTSRAVQKKDISQAPSISTFRAVKRGLDEPATEVKVKAKNVSTSSDESAPPVPPLPKDEDLPASLKNIRKLSHMDEEPKREVNGMHNRLTLFENNDNVIEYHKKTTMLESSPTMKEERKSWSPSNLQSSPVKTAYNKENEPNNNMTTTPTTIEHGRSKEAPSHEKARAHESPISARPITIIESSSASCLSGRSSGVPSENTLKESSSTQSEGLSSSSSAMSSVIKSMDSASTASETRSSRESLSSQAYRYRDPSSQNYSRNASESHTGVSKHYVEENNSKSGHYQRAKDVVLFKSSDESSYLAKPQESQVTEFEACLNKRGQVLYKEEDVSPAAVTSQSYVIDPPKEKHASWSPQIPPWYQPCNTIEIVDTTPTVNEILAEKAKELEKTSGAVKSGDETLLVKPSQVMAMQRTGGDLVDDSWHTSSDRYKTHDYEQFTFSKPSQSPEKSPPTISPTRVHEKPASKRVDRKLKNREEKTDLSPECQKSEKVSADNARVHIRKTWGSKSPEQSVQNGMPKTDPELRKAYFQQVEEINSLKQQLGMKDKRIRQLEQELREARLGKLGESDC